MSSSAHSISLTGCTTGIRRKATSISGHPPLSGWTTEVRTASCSARTYPYHPVELLHIFLHELAHIYCVHHELDGKSFYDEYCEGYAHSNEEDGMINAGYAVWRECIAEIIAIECDDNCDIFPIRDKKKNARPTQGRDQPAGRKLLGERDSNSGDDQR